MAIFVILKQYLRFFGIVEFDGPYARIIRIFLNIVIPIGFLGGTVAAATYFMFEKDYNLQKRLQNCCPLQSFCYVTSVAVVLIIQKKQFTQMIEDVEGIIKVRERKYNCAAYEDTSGWVEALTIKIFVFVNGIITFLLTIVPATVGSYYNYCVNDMGEASFIEILPAK